ncbi:YeiH family protein [Prosthecobacter sp.]|uniref:YeiH family protein n=1 Tax=Prosthecobacter sp. TaxID=1965333 RepID=UPI003783C2FC
MPANPAAADSAYPSPGPSTARWWQNEDWLAVLAALPLLIAVAKGWNPKMPAMAWSGAADWSKAFSADNFAVSGVLLAVFLGISVLALAASLGKKIGAFLCGAVVVFVLGWLSQWIAGYAGVKAWGLEYVVFALGLGLLWSHLLPVPGWLREAVRTEFFIKVGIVLLGATILLQEMMKAGLPGLAQAALVIPVVWYVCYFISRKLKVDDEFGVMLSTAVSICGVSAAIAACGAIQGDRKKLSYVTSIVLLCAVPMMILMPWAIKSMGLSEAVGGAWIGGTLDTSGSVAAATEQVGKDATKIGVIVKLSQNVLIGVAAFVLSIWWTMRGGKDGASKKEKPSIGVIWERFPKFVIGFVIASVVFSYFVPTAVVEASSKPLKGLRELWFAAAFVCIGLETRLGELFNLGGGKPALAFLGGQIFNIAWTLILAMWLFGN